MKKRTDAHIYVKYSIWLWLLEFSLYIYVPVYIYLYLYIYINENNNNNKFVVHPSPYKDAKKKGLEKKIHTNHRNLE